MAGWVRVGAVWSALAVGLSAQTLPEQAVELPAFSVNADDDADETFDTTGMGAGDAEMNDPVFANELTAVDYDLEEALESDTAAELTNLGTPSPADAVAGEQRLNLRGFPTPVLRNGFIQMGILETLNVDRTIVIQGPLVPVLGRAAPGGIQNFLTARPSARARNRVDVSTASDGRTRLRWEMTGAVQPKKLWQRWAVDWQRRVGDEAFMREEDLAVSGSLTWKHSRAASSMVSVDYRRYDGHPTAGIPEYKETALGKTIAPYRPLADFNVNGPEAGVTRETLLVALQFDRQVNRAIALRVAAEGWTRSIEQERFTASQYVLETGRMAGIREPRHGTQEQEAVAAHAEVTGRFRTGKIDHKLLGFAGVTWGDYRRDDRALSVAERDALPETVRSFDPFRPDFTYPAFDPERYSRVITARTQAARYSTLELGDRISPDQGRTVVTAGLRYDEVDLHIRDGRPAAVFPRVEDRTAQLSYHAGVNYQLVRNRALLFATTSTAFDPTTPVDSRTGQIQKNETTLGYEAGLRGRVAAKRLDYTVSGFLLYNRDIARRNPLYDDPILDVNQTQPQLVAAGEERFAGWRADGRYRFSDRLYLAVRGVRMDAITTKSPALGSEVGQQVARLPRETATVQMRYGPAKGAAGFNASAGLSYIGDYVANYEDSRHAYLAYPDYTLLSLGAGYSWKIGERQASVGVSLRNVLDRDLLASNARTNAGRSVGVSARMMF